MACNESEIDRRLDWCARMARNTWPLFVRMAISTIAGLLAVRIALDALSVTGYGVFVAVNAVVAAIMTFNGVLQVTAQRFLSHEMGHGNEERLSAAFSSICCLSLFLSCLIVLGGESIGLWFVHNRLSLPVGSVESANFAFQACMVMAVVNTLQLPWAALIVAGERMAFFAKLSVVEALFAIGAPAVAMAFHLRPSGYGATSPDFAMPVYATILCCGTVVVLAIHVLYCRRQFPSVHLMFRFPTRDLWDSVSFFFWGTLSSIGNLLKYQGVNILMNLHAGVTFNSSWDVAMRTGGVVQVGSGCFQPAYSPVIYKEWTNPDKMSFGRLIGVTTLVSFLMSAIPGSIAFVFAHTILNVWLGAELPPQAVAFVRCAVVNMVFDAISAPLTVAILSTGRVALYQTLAFIMSAASFLLAWVLLSAGCNAWTAICAVASFNGLAALYRFLHVRFIIGVQIRLAPIPASFPWRRRIAGETGAPSGMAT